MKRVWNCMIDKTPGQRWRYSVADPEDGLEMLFFTNRLEAASHAQRAAVTTGHVQAFRDRRTKPDAARTEQVEREGSRESISLDPKEGC